MNRLKCVAMCVGLAWPLAAVAEEEPTRFDHRGSLGGHIAGGAEFVSSSLSSTDNGLRTLFEAGGTLSVTDHLEVKVAGRLSPYPALLTAGAIAGIRNSFGYAKFKTFFDLDVLLHVATLVNADGVPQPARFSIGPHVAFGAQYDFSQIAGVWSSLGATFGFGSGLRLQFELLVGLQFRTYLFD